LQALLQDIRYGVRTLSKSPGFTLAAVLMLALAIGANTALFSTVKAVVLNSLPYKAPERLVTLAASESTSLNPQNVSYGKTQDWRERSHSFESIALYRSWRPGLSGNTKAEMLSGVRVSKEFFDTLGILPLLGREFLAEEDQPGRWHVALLTYAFWKDQFGARQDIVGQTIELDRVPFQVVGVLPENFKPLIFSYFKEPPQVWAPLGYDASIPNACRGCQHLRAVARLRQGVTLAGARAEMKEISVQLAREFPEAYGREEILLIRLLQEAVVGKLRATLWLLLGCTVFVLMIACANITNLLLSRALAKQRELAVRSALGATRARLVRQILVESMLFTIVGGFCGCVLAYWGTKALAAWGPTDIPRLNETRLDGMVLLSLGATFLTAIFAGLFPSLQASRSNERQALQSGMRGTAGPSQRRFRSVLVVGEVGLAFVLVIGTGLLLRSLERVMGVQPGFETQNLQTMNIALRGPNYEKDPAILEFERQALARIRTIPGVQDAALVSTLPLGGGYDQRNIFIQDRPHVNDADAPGVDTYYVSENYFETMRVGLRRGRYFTAADFNAGSEARVALVSQGTATKLWPGENPIGKRIQLGEHGEKFPWSTIVGIVEDVKQYGLDTPANAEAYQPYSQNPDNSPDLVIRSSMATELLRREVEQQISSLDKDVPVFGARAMESIIGDSLVQRKFVAGLAGGFGLLALLLAAIGIYGVMSYGVAQRTSEFGIRLAMGAQPGDLLLMVLSGAGRLMVGGIGFGLAMALALTKFMRGMLFEVSPQDPGTILAVGVLMCFVALVACWIPSRRATRVDPMAALRYE
jgi:putative ABC transport system permease protein